VTSKSIIEAERVENLAAFEEAFPKLDGVTEEHVRTLRRARSTRGLVPYLAIGDDMAQAAYVAAALRGLTDAIAVLQAKAKK